MPAGQAINTQVFPIQTLSPDALPAALAADPNSLLSSG